MNINFIATKYIVLLSLCLQSLSTIAVWSPFIENKGQMKDLNGNELTGVLFKTSAPGMDIYITKKGLTYLFWDLQYAKGQDFLMSNMDSINLEIGCRPSHLAIAPESYTCSKIEMHLNGASIKSKNIQASKSDNIARSYYYSHCPDGISNVNAFNQILIKDIYPGIDWELMIQNGSLKTQYIIHPYADPSQVKMLYIGHGNVDISSNNQISLHSNGKSIQEAPLYCYYKTNNDVIGSSYSINAPATNKKNPQSTNDENTILNKLIGINLFKYQEEETIIIDPYIEWATLLGGLADETVSGMQHDKNGNIFITGATFSLDFPVFDNGSYIDSGQFADEGDIYITKFSSEGVMLWSTYYGGSELDVPLCITIDNNNKIIVAGYTSSFSFPVKDDGGFHQPLFGGGSMPEPADGFIMIFDNSGNRNKATFYGGTSNEIIKSIDIDSENNIYFTGNNFGGGTSPGLNFPLKNSGGFYRDNFSGAEAFIGSFNNSNKLVWSSYINEFSSVIFNPISLSINSKNDIYISGPTGGNMPLQNSGGYFDDTQNGELDMYLMRFSKDHDLTWATYFGTDNHDDSPNLKVDNNDDLYLFSRTLSDNFPLLDGGGYMDSIAGPLNFSGNVSESVLLKFDDKDNLIWSTYIGGSGADQTYGHVKDIDVDSKNNIYIAFASTSSDLPFSDVAPCDYGDTLGQDFWKRHILSFDENTNLIWSSYVGGQTFNFYGALTVNIDDKLFVGAEYQVNPSSPDIIGFPFKDPGGGAFMDTNATNPAREASIIKINMDNYPGTNDTMYVRICPGDTANMYSLVKSGSYRWDTGETTDTIKVAPIEMQTYMVIADPCGDTVVWKVDASIDTIANPMVICEGDELTLTAPDSAAYYVWDNGIENQTTTYILNESTTLYVATACSTTLSYEVEVLPKVACTELFVPNAFILNSTNNDGLVLYGAAQSLEVEIFNNLGQHIYSNSIQSQNPFAPIKLWDGYIGSRLVQSGVYIYKVTAVYEDNVKVLEGNVTVLR